MNISSRFRVSVSWGERISFSNSLTLILELNYVLVLIFLSILEIEVVLLLIFVLEFVSILILEVELVLEL